MTQEHGVRLSVLEQRVVALRNDHDSLQSDMKELSDDLKGFTKTMTAILVSVATSAVLLALNLVINGFAPK